jgi:hypothetical protein
LFEVQKTEQDVKDLQKILRDLDQESSWQAHWIEERKQNYERQELENEELTKISHEAEELRYKNEMEEVHKNLENKKRPQVQKELQAQQDFGRDRSNLDNEFERRKESILLAHVLADKMHKERTAKTRAEFAERKKLQAERRKQLLLMLDQEDEKLKEEEKAANYKLENSKVLRKSLQTEELDNLVEQKSEGLRTLKQKEIDLADLQKKTRQELLDQEDKAILEVVQNHERKNRKIVDYQQKRSAEIKITRESTLQHHRIEQAKLDKKTQDASARLLQLRAKLDALNQASSNDEGDEPQSTIEQPEKVQLIEDTHSDNLQLDRRKSDHIQSDRLNQDDVQSDDIPSNDIQSDEIQSANTG